jgi:DNA-binding IclR family transcriptional regulator
MNSVLGKAKLILEAYTAADDVLSLTDLVRRTGVAKATVHRLAQELLTWGVLERVDSGYRLGLRLFEIGQRVPRQRILREAALPYMEDLLMATQETIHVAVHDGRLPLYCTATGKVILAFSPPSLFLEVVRAGLTPLTRHTITSPALLADQLERVRSQQLATEHEETRLGYASMAVPVYGGSGVLVAAVSITAPTARINVPRLSGLLRAAGVGITRTLRAMG